MSSIKERQILFIGEMVRAILDGRKTQTRRVIKNQPDGMDPVYIKDFKKDFGGRKCPYGQKGDQLWVRETFQNIGHSIEFKNVTKKVLFKADCRDSMGHLWPSVAANPSNCNWKPSIHMPRWASRIQLEVTDIRVERVKDMKDDECLKEGIHVDPDYFNSSMGKVAAFEHFKKLWNSINEKRGYPWESNPWVWVVEFKRAN